MTERDEKELIDGVTEGETTTVNSHDLFGYQFEAWVPEGQRREQQIELSADQHAAAFGVQAQPTRMDRRPGEAPLKHAEKSPMDIFGPPQAGDGVAGMLDRLKALEDEKNG